MIDQRITFEVCFAKGSIVDIDAHMFDLYIYPHADFLRSYVHAQCQLRECPRGLLASGMPQRVAAFLEACAKLKGGVKGEEKGADGWG